jgi:hypothetical protein
MDNDDGTKQANITMPVSSFWEERKHRLALSGEVFVVCPHLCLCITTKSVCVLTTIIIISFVHDIIVNAAVVVLVVDNNNGRHSYGGGWGDLKKQIKSPFPLL